MASSGHHLTHCGPSAFSLHVDYFGFWMQHNGAIVAGFDAPAAAVAFVLVQHDVARVFGLRECISWASGYAGWGFTESAGNSHVG
jgi:hypothetical protein